MEIEIEEKYLEKPWLRSHRMACIPETLEPYPEVAYTEHVLDGPTKKYPNELALVCSDYEITFKELKEHVDRFATALSDMGVKKGTWSGPFFQLPYNSSYLILPYPEYKGKIKEEEIINYLRGKFPPYAVPKSVEFRDELPKTTAEKIFKRQLRNEEIEKMKGTKFEERRYVKDGSKE